MSNRREKSRKNVIWTQEMLSDLTSCKALAIEQKSGDNPPRKPDGRKMGYMEIMKQLWDAKGYLHLGLSSQNLADILNVNKRKVATLSTEVEITIATELNITETATIRNNNSSYDRNAEASVQCVPENFEASTGNNSLDDVLLRKLIDEGNNIFESIFNDSGNMDNRLWNTKFKNTPTSKAIIYINEVCIALIDSKHLLEQTDCIKSLWLLNCIVYSAISAWILVNDLKGMKINKESKSCNVIPKAIKVIDDEIKETRSFLSKCVAEKDRLTNKGRLTRKTKRNRKEMLKYCENISIYSLTCIIAHRKKRLTYLARKRKRKLKQEETRRINKQFNENQSMVFNKFQKAIDEDPENLEPKFDVKNNNTERKYFDNSADVEAFWRKLWEADDKGNPSAEWLNTFREMFKEMVPDIEGEVEFSETDCFDNIRRKKNWSSPGPDRIANFWWKKLKLVKYIHPIFYRMINETIPAPEWYCCGRTGLIPKDGEWAISNQRPITCLINMYKWLTSILKMKSDQHLKRYSLMQVDQRGACEGVSGTIDNLMIDDMVQRDAILNKRNLFTTWIDVRKAFDSVSHSFLIEVLKIHRFPAKLVATVKNIIETWNIVLVIPLKDKSFESKPIKLRNGELQGDTYCPNLYTLCNNLVSWKIRSFKGYVLSKPIKEKVTHSLFIDDLKVYSNSITAAVNSLNEIKPCMKDGGLEWNSGKCKACLLTRGKFSEHQDLVLEDGTKIECLKEGETYKFMGVYQSTKLDKDGLESSLLKTVKQRAHVIWSSELYDANKTLATNMFVNACVEYYLWGCNMRIDFLKEVDRSIRRVMNVCGAKHTNTVNEGLYLPRCKGGRGLRSVENSYKEIKVKAAVKLKRNEDPRMKLVNKFHQVHLNTNSYSLFKEATRYCAEKGLQCRCDEDEIVISNSEEAISSSEENCNYKLKRLLRSVNESRNLQVVLGCSWQGVILKTILEDETKVKGYFDWLWRWKSCPTSTISEMMLLLYQTLDTKCYRKHLKPAGSGDNDTICRLCKQGQESVKHLLSNCGFLVKKVYMKRHNDVLKCFFFELLGKLGFIKDVPSWFSNVAMKPEYENDDYLVNWDIPEYSGKDGETLRDCATPDGKLVMKNEKKIFLIEQTVPWITNRDAKYDYKETKYDDIQTFLRLENPDFVVDQITLVMDVFGGFSENLRKNIEKILEKDATTRVITNMQKAVISNEAHLSRVFKIRTKR